MLTVVELLFIFMVTFGQRVREERLRKNLSIDEVARATKIRVQFIRDIENGNFTRLPSSAYTTGFVKNYVDFLGLPSKELLAKFRREYDAREHRDILPESLTSQRSIDVKRTYWERYLLFALIIIIPLLIYLFFQYRGIFFGPYLIVTQPKNNVSLQASEVTIEGTVDTNSTVTVNDVATFVDSSGHFRKIVSVFTGRDVIRIRAVNAFGKSTEIVRTVIVKE